MLPSVAPRVAVELVTGTVLETLMLLRVVPRVTVRLVTGAVLEALVLLSVVPAVAVKLGYRHRAGRFRAIQRRTPHILSQKSYKV